MHVFFSVVSGSKVTWNAPKSEEKRVATQFSLKYKRVCSLARIAADPSAGWTSSIPQILPAVTSIYAARGPKYR